MMENTSLAGERPVRRVALYFALTFLYTWTFWGLAVALGLRWPEAGAILLLALGGIGPALIATFFVSRGDRREGAGAFWRRAFDWRRVPPRWFLVALFVPFVPPLLARLWPIEQGSAPGLELGGAALATFVIGVLAGIAEEPGWRGYALDRLQAAYPALAASLVVGVGWALWHLPLFFIAGTYHNLLGLGTPAFWLFFVALVPGSVVYAWVYNNANRGILAVVLFHALGNVAGEVLSPEGAQRVVELLAVVALALAVALVWGPRTLAGRSGTRETARPGR
jgi:uncharacterized protein